MRYVLAVIIPLIIYFGIGWIAKDIYFSMWEITASTTIRDIYNKEIFIYCCVAVGYIFICFQITDELVMIYFGAVPVIAYILCAYIFPMSEGAALLNSILCVVVLIYASMLVATKDDL